VGPEVARRLGALAAEPDEAFALLPTGEVLWRGEAAGALAGDQPFSPAVRLYGEFGPAAARERATRRLEAFVAAEASRRLRPLKALGEAVASGALKGLARGLAYRLIEAGGVLPRRGAEGDLAQLSRAERRALRTLGVRFGEFSLFLPALVQPQTHAFALAFARQAAPDWPAGDGPLIRLPVPPPPGRALGLRGLMVVAGLAVPVQDLERLGERLRAAAGGGGVRLTEAARTELGWSGAEAARILRGLGYAPVRRPAPDEAVVWRRRRPKSEAPFAPPVNSASPFAALAAIKPQPHAPRAARRRPRRRPSAPAAHG
jgi:ATP-dependent RNA helicase SUPV3L1/SUV3